MDLLPEDCIAHICSFATPLDACRMCLVSSTVQCTVDSDSVWARFLPSNYQDIVATSDDAPFKFSSMKDLFFKLCTPLLIDGGKKVFWLDKRTAKKCYILSARELSVTWASNPLYWSWKPSNGSRFPEVAELRTVCWLEIQGSVAAPALSPKSTYEVFLIAQFANTDVAKYHSQTQSFHSSNQPSLEYVCYSNSTKVLRSRVCGECVQLARARDDGWIEIKLGEFYNYGFDQEDQQVEMSRIEVKGVYLKGGLIVEGIEIRVKP
ncbi:unnamed protein product [Rhodiola kirilowii]